MHYLLVAIAFFIIFFGLINLFRMALFLVASDIYTLKKHFHSRKKLPHFTPFVSVVIPAHNEAVSIIKCLSSVLASDYPMRKLEVIVVNDGSTDKTQEVLEKYVNSRICLNVTLVTQKNLGKAHALNNGIKNYASGELIMCLDADSFLDSGALRTAVRYFNDKTIVGLASNVKIMPGRGLLNFIQRYEYLISYQMKRAQTVLNIEYIIGGIGSMFRKSYLEHISYYDTNTVTEDIDITMKLLHFGNKNIKLYYASDVIVYTQSALSVRDLIRQRFRWKWGRYQTFFKNTNLFFSPDYKHSKGLSWIYLPYALFSDATFFLEPFILGYILFIVIVYHDLFTLISVCLVTSIYTLMNILAEDTLTFFQKVKMAVFVPFMYVLFYLLSYVEYVALIKSITKLHLLKDSLSHNIATWKPIPRTGLGTQG